jgi:hypothetical protein
MKLTAAKRGLLDEMARTGAKATRERGRQYLWTVNGRRVTPGTLLDLLEAGALVFDRPGTLRLASNIRWRQ